MGRPSNVGGEDHVVHVQEGVIWLKRVPWNELVDAGWVPRVVDGRRCDLPALERGDECVRVVEVGAGSVEVDHAVLHQVELVFADYAHGVGRERCMEGNDVSLAEKLPKAVRRLVGIRVARDHPHSEALQTPSDGSPDLTQADETGGTTGQLPGSVPLRREAAVLPDLADAHITIGRGRPSGTQRAAARG